jgi:hypothetical protein
VTSNVPGRDVKILKGFGRAEEIIGHRHASQEVVKTGNWRRSEQVARYRVIKNIIHSTKTLYIPHVFTHIQFSFRCIVLQDFICFCILKDLCPNFHP